MFHDRGWHFGELKTLIGENDSIGNVDPRLPCGCITVDACISAKINDAKDLTLIFLVNTFCSFTSCAGKYLKHVLCFTLFTTNTLSQLVNEMLIVSGR